MKTGYYNGEKVYVLKWPGHVSYSGFIEPCKVQIIKHRDLVRLLNKLFTEIENADDRALEEPLGITFLMYGLLSNFNNKRNWVLPFEAKDKNTFVFDDHQKVKKAKMPRLYAGTRNTKNVGNLKVHKGGLYISPAAKTHDGLSDKFKKFLE